MSLYVGDCVLMGIRDALGVFTLLIAISIVSLQIFLNCSNAWRFFYCSLAFPLFSLIISISSLSPICIL